MKKIEFFKIEGDRINRIRKHCPKCGPGVFLADHKNRFSCGKCGYAEFKGGGKPPKPPIAEEKPVESSTPIPKPETLPVKEPPIEESPIEETPIDETKGKPPVEPIPEPPKVEISPKEDTDEPEKKEKTPQKEEPTEHKEKTEVLTEKKSEEESTEEENKE